MVKKVKLKDLKENPTNPRFITDSKFKKLVKSIKEFPDMLEKRPIVVDEDMIVLGGNMRLKACKEAGIKEVWINIAENWTEEQKKEFIIKDNLGYGEWDFDILANEWQQELLNDWGLDLPQFDEIDEFDEPYTKKIDAPNYEPSDEKPELLDLYDDSKYKSILYKIDKSQLDVKTKEFLSKAASRHIIFNYSKIADFYAHSDKKTQELMEDSALVIIDFEKAIEQGYVQLSEKITEQYLEEHGE